MDDSILTETDILIIGAGVMGASVAYQLSREHNRRVVVIDQHSPLGGMSGRTFGQVRLHYSNALMLQLAMRGYEVFAQWQDEVGYGDPGYVPMGYMLIVVRDQLQALHRNIELAQGLGINTRFIDPQEIKRLEPAINIDGLEGGAYDPAGGYIDVTRIVLSWLSAAQENGIQLMTGVRAEAIETAGDRVTGVTTTHGKINAPIIVNVTGSWGKELFSPLGIELPLEVRRLDTLYLRQPPGGAQIGCCITDGNSNVAIRPDMGRDFLVGAYPKEMPEVADPATHGNDVAHAEHLSRVRHSLTERIPELAKAEPLRSVSGTYDITPDWHPVVGWVPQLSGLYTACGFSGHGLKLAPALGEAIAAALLERESAFDLSPLRLQRFAENDPMYLAYGPGGRA